MNDNFANLEAISPPPQGALTRLWFGLVDIAETIALGAGSLLFGRR